MSQLETFKSELGSVRVTTINGKPFFVGKDVADILGYQNGSRDINRHVDEEDRRKVMIFDGNQDKETIVINESGMYSLILSSKLPTAKRFKHWVTSEVLPAIRQHGGYINGQETMSDDELIAKALLVAQSKIEQRDRQIAEQSARIEEMRPKEIFADAVTASAGSILVRDLAKLIQQNGVNIGERRLFAWLREHGYICRRSTQPTQKAMELGLFEILERTIVRGDMPNLVKATTKVTGKGQVYFINKFLASCGGGVKQP